ncbi:Histidine phosphatase superfamily (branch 1) [Jannaschia seosinensis]|uniref:Histidine phosphatase superfamily (Branch 1) n=1 Tax=Jannaschia seosinensis TaxID=313367 RepID=A0A0M7B789_9RHOB|nr:hypothetical protein [Jannaschia seosinensis]CUH21355.1 Histidine phosphatase superfamily (branch 1) [Jannaschia seosinensis]CUH40555.1 Histidine phosphatase superfamily (branch 1) [Jannaschia seosinensis]
MKHRITSVAAALAFAAALPVSAQDAAGMPKWKGEIEPVSGFAGQMSMSMETDAPEEMVVEEVISFEPWQMLDDLFRDDLVFIMRGGPSEWDVRDAPGTAPSDCEDQRLLTETGQDQMRQLGALLIVNGLRPGEVLLSQWCRAQQTYLGLEEGMLEADMNALDGVEARVDAALNPLGKLAGPEDAEALREMVMAWDGKDAGGPLLLITHFDNIVELTRFRVYEGEVLILDPTRDGRVLGYLRLGSAGPDAVRFDPDVVAFAREGVSPEDDDAEAAD